MHDVVCGVHDVVCSVHDVHVEPYDAPSGLHDVLWLAEGDCVVPYAVLPFRIRSVVVRYDEEGGMGVSGSTFRLGELLRLARHAVGSDQATFGERVGVSSRTVSRWETASQALTADQRPRVVQALSAAPRDIVEELARLLGVASPYPSATAVVAPPRTAPTATELRAVLDAVVFAASEERDVLPRHLRAFGVELLLAIDRAGVSAKEAAALVAARDRGTVHRPSKAG